MPTWTVAGPATKLRLDVFLTDQLGQPRSQVQRSIQGGRVTVNGRPAKSVHEWLRPNDVVGVAEAETLPAGEPARAPAPDVPIVAEGDGYVVVCKPAGLAVHPAPGVSGPTLVDWLRQRYPEAPILRQDGERPGIVHRLDRDVSGCLVVALTPAAAEWLRQQFADRLVEKEYVALVNGRVEGESGEVTLPIGRSRSGRMAAHVTPGEDDRSASTTWEVLERFVNFTLLQLRPLTGRTHQLRVHCKALGHSIVGDPVYVTRDARHRPRALGRPFLHARRLSFTAPDGQRVDASCGLPAELASYLSQLKRA